LAIHLTSANVLSCVRNGGAPKVAADAVGAKHCDGDAPSCPCRRAPELSRISGFFVLPSDELHPQRAGVPHLSPMGGFSAFFLWLNWGMRVVAIGARALAVAELCNHLLARYRGIWGLAWRVLFAFAASGLIHASIAAEYQWKLALVRAERGLELAIATVIVGVFVFVQYYGVEAKPADRSLMMGFCLYSCFNVINSTFLERFLDNYVTLWNFLGMLAYLGSLLVWTWALLKTQTEDVAEAALLPAGIYQILTPQINDRLRSLNDQLSHFWHTGGTQS
jgi:hypothetical protein